MRDLLPPGEVPARRRELWTHCGCLAGVQSVTTVVTRLEALVAVAASLPA